jgi:hypothetical protein
MSSPFSEWIVSPGRLTPESPAQAHHPAYLHALADLRAARWLIEHRPGDWTQTGDEMEAVRSICPELSMG